MDTILLFLLKNSMIDQFNRGRVKVIPSSKKPFSYELGFLPVGIHQEWVFRSSGLLSFCLKGQPFAQAI